MEKKEKENKQTAEIYEEGKTKGGKEKETV